MLLSHINVSLPLFLSCPLSKKNKYFLKTPIYNRNTKNKILKDKLKEVKVLYIEYYNTLTLMKLI